MSCSLPVCRGARKPGKTGFGFTETLCFHKVCCVAEERRPQRQSCGCSYTSSNNRGDFCNGSSLSKINHCCGYGCNSKCFRNNQADLVRKVISRDLDVSFTFSVKQCVRCPGIFLGDTNFCSMHYWEKYNVLCRQLCLDVATSLWQVCLQEGWMFARSTGQKVAVAGKGQVKAFRQVGFLVQFVWVNNPKGCFFSPLDC